MAISRSHQAREMTMVRVGMRLRGTTEIVAKLFCMACKLGRVLIFRVLIRRSFMRLGPYDGARNCGRASGMHGAMPARVVPATNVTVA